MREFPSADFKKIVAAVRAAVASKKPDPSENAVRSHDDRQSMRVGFTFDGAWYHGPATAIRGRRFDPEWESLIVRSSGRRVMADCLSHQHGPDVVASCRYCAVRAVMES